MWVVLCLALICFVSATDDAIDPFADLNCSTPCNKAIDLFFGMCDHFMLFSHLCVAIDTSASLSPSEMSNARDFMKNLLPLLAIAPGDDTKVEISVSFFWIHNGMIESQVILF
jgi:hypothetical protein